MTPPHAFDVILLLATFRPASRPAASSTSSASYPESRAACTTCVSCAARGCGTAGTFPPWNVLVNIQTRRAAPMEAPPPPSPPRPPRPPRPRPHRNPPPRLHRWARKVPKLGIFSLSGNSPEMEAVGGGRRTAGISSCWGPSAGFLNHLLPPLAPQPPRLVSLFLRSRVTRSFHVLQCGTLPYRNVFRTFGPTQKVFAAELMGPR